MSWISVAIGSAVAMFLAAGQAAQAQTCRPVVERTGDLGCWILTHQPVGQLNRPEVFWHLDVYPTKAGAESAKTSTGAVVAAFDKIWLLTIAEKGWIPSSGDRVAEIGPIPVTPGQSYMAQYMEASLKPGSVSPSHMHSGPEAIFVLAGEHCMETPDGKQVRGANDQPVIVPGGPPMHLTVTGTGIRRALVLILHDPTKAATAPAPQWTPKELCKS